MVILCELLINVVFYLINRSSQNAFASLASSGTNALDQDAQSGGGFGGSSGGSAFGSG